MISLKTGQLNNINSGLILHFQLWKVKLIEVFCCTKRKYTVKFLYLDILLAVKMIVKVIQINPFSTNVPLLYPLEISENIRFSAIYKGNRSGTLVENGLIAVQFIYDTLGSLTKWKCLNLNRMRIIIVNLNGILHKTRIFIFQDKYSCCSYQVSTTYIPKGRRCLIHLLPMYPFNIP